MTFPREMNEKGLDLLIEAETAALPEKTQGKMPPSLSLSERKSYRYINANAGISNCASSVEPFNAVVELSPPVIVI